MIMAICRCKSSSCSPSDFVFEFIYFCLTIVILLFLRLFPSLRHSITTSVCCSRWPESVHRVYQRLFAACSCFNMTLMRAVRVNQAVWCKHRQQNQKMVKAEEKCSVGDNVNCLLHVTLFALLM